MATTVFEKPMWYNVATQSEDGLMSSTDKTKLDGVAAGATANTGTITGITMNGASKGTSGVVDLGTVITSHQDISGKVAGPSSATANAVAIFDGTGGKTIKDSGYTIGKSVPSDAKFTDTTYSNATQSAAGLMSSTDKTKLDGIATGATANTGTITGIKMNGSSKGTSGVVDLGTVITSHQDISGKVSGPSSATNNAVAIFDGTGGKTIKNSGYTIGKSVPSDAVFTDHTYSCTDKNVTLAWGTKSTIATACGTDIHVTMPSNPNTNTHRPIQMNGSQILGDNTTALNLKAGSNVTLSNSSGTVTIAATDTNTWRGIQNNLTSTSTTDSLSAYQGKLLNDNATFSYASASSTTSADPGSGMLIYKNSHTVIVNAEITTKKSVSAYTSLVTGLPKPSKTINFTASSDGLTTVYPLYITSNGEICSRVAISTYPFTLYGSVAYYI